MWESLKIVVACCPLYYQVGGKIADCFCLPCSCGSLVSRLSMLLSSLVLFCVNFDIILCMNCLSVSDLDVLLEIIKNIP